MGSEAIQRRYARTAGLFYLLVLAFDIAGMVIGSSSHDSAVMQRVGLSLALLGSLSTIPLALGLFVTLRPADPNLATAGLIFRSVEATIGGIAVASSLALAASNPLSHVTNVAAIYFCIGSTIFFYVFTRTRYIPGLMSWWGVTASLVYLVMWFAELIAPDTPGIVSIVASVPILIAEVGTGLWLLIAGIRLEPD